MSGLFVSIFTLDAVYKVEAVFVIIPIGTTQSGHFDFISYFFTGFGACHTIAVLSKI